MPGAWPGFSFALHLLRVQGFCFALLQYASPYKRLQRILCRQCSLYRPRRKTVHRALQWLFLRLHPLNRRKYQTGTNGYNTACTTLERITAPQHLQHIPDTSATPDAAQGSTAALYSRPIIIRYIRVQHIADHASPAGSAPAVCGSLASADTLSAVQTRRTC